jgi:uncharacterized protein (TIGR03382 family)
MAGGELPSDGVLVARVDSPIPETSVRIVGPDDLAVPFEMLPLEPNGGGGLWLRVRPQAPLVEGELYTWTVGSRDQTFRALEPASPPFVDGASFEVRLIDEGFSRSGCLLPQEEYFRLYEVVVSGVDGPHAYGAVIDVENYLPGTVIRAEGELRATISLIRGYGGCFDVFVEDLLGRRIELGNECISEVTPPLPPPSAEGSSTGSPDSTGTGELPSGLPPGEDTATTDAAPEHMGPEQPTDSGCTCTTSTKGSEAGWSWLLLVGALRRRPS